MQGRPGAGDGGPADLDASFAALFQLGLHAMEGAPRAVLAHSFDGSIVDYRVDDPRVGEIWMNCYTAGLSDVPCVFLSGDRAAAEEVQALVPEVEVAIVEEGLSIASVLRVWEEDRRRARYDRRGSDRRATDEGGT